MIFLNLNSRFLFFSILCLSCLCGIAGAQTFTGAGFTIVDGGGNTTTSCSTVTVSGITGNTNLTSIQVNNLSHTFIGDIQIALVRPGRTINARDIISSPPDDRECDFSGANLVFSDGGAQTLDVATAGCTDNQIIPGGTYLGSTYGGGTGNGAQKSVLYTFGLLPPAQSNGNWLVCVLDYVNGDGGTVGSTSITFTPTTAAGAEIGGKIVGKDNAGVANAKITVIDMFGNKQTTISNSFGYFKFTDMPSAQTYTITVSSKQYKFIPQSFNLNSNLNDLIFVAN